MRDAQAIQSDLSQFSGTEQYHRLTVMPVQATDGVKFLAEECGAFWLVDLIASHYLATRGVDSCLFCTLTVNEDKSADFVGDDGNGGILCTQRIPFTDFPLPSVKVWVMDGVMLLPSEY